MLVNPVNYEQTEDFCFSCSDLPERRFTVRDNTEVKKIAIGWFCGYILYSNHLALIPAAQIITTLL